MECCQARNALYQSSNAVSGTSILERITGEKTDDALEEVLHVEEAELVSLFRRTFGPEMMDKFRKFLALQCYRGAMLVRDKLYNHSSSALPHSSSVLTLLSYGVIFNSCYHV